MNIYELTGVGLQLYELMEDPDVSPEAIADTFECFELDYKDKADAYAKVIRMSELNAEALKAEEERLASRRKAIEANVAKVKATLLKSMEQLNLKSVKTEKFTFSRRASSSVEIDDDTKIPAEFQNVEMTLKPDKKKIKEYLSGLETAPDWAHIKHSESLIIK